MRGRLARSRREILRWWRAGGWAMVTARSIQRPVNRTLAARLRPTVPGAAWSRPTIYCLSLTKNGGSWAEYLGTAAPARVRLPLRKRAMRDFAYRSAFSAT